MNPFFTRGRRETREEPPDSPTSPTGVSFPPPAASRNGNVLRIMSPAGERLSIIMEHGSLAPPKIPPKSPNRYRTSSRGSISQATVVSTGATTLTPDEKIKNWSIWSDDGRDESEPPLGRLAQLRQNRHVARRGGWRRMLLCLLIFLVILVAVVIGVVLGTRRHKKDSSDSNPAISQNNANSGATTTVYLNSNPTATGDSSGSKPSTTAIAIPASFPVGTYSIRTFLDTVITDCTSNPDTWSCFPYSTYNQSPVKALTTFTWVISQSSDKKSLSISSTSNPFSATFSNTPLTLVDAGQSTERYKFQISMDKEVRPNTNLTADGTATTCDYSGTTFTAYLYTKIAATYPSDKDGSAVAAGAATNPPAWPFQVRVEQTMGAGDNVPSCYKITNGNIGDRVKVDGAAAGSLCSCLYRNVYVPNPN